MWCTLRFRVWDIIWVLSSITRNSRKQDENTKLKKMRRGSMHIFPSCLFANQRFAQLRSAAFSVQPAPHTKFAKINEMHQKGGGGGCAGEIWWLSKKGVGRVQKHEKKQTANRRESRPSGSQNRICVSSLEHGGSYRPAGSSLIGSVRANPVAAPAAPVRGNGCFLLYLGVRGRDFGVERPAVGNLIFDSVRWRYNFYRL